jgi:hypothetical protein
LTEAFGAWLCKKLLRQCKAVRVKFFEASAESLRKNTGCCDPLIQASPRALSSSKTWNKAGRAGQTSHTHEAEQHRKTAMTVASMTSVITCSPLRSFAACCSPDRCIIKGEKCPADFWLCCATRASAIATAPCV